jgi:hypothetical protein
MAVRRKIRRLGEVKKPFSGQTNDKHANPNKRELCAATYLCGTIASG